MNSFAGSANGAGRITLVLLLWSVLPVEVTAVDYLSEIKPLLKEKCYACHGVLKQKGGLRLDTVELILKGGKSGPALVPGDPAGSSMVVRVSHADDDERMPQEAAALSSGQIERIRGWIAAGAPAPENEKPENDPADHWSFRPISRPPLPDVDGPIRNEIDHFIFAKLTEKNLVPSEEASKPVLLRRIYLDLVGVPPTREEFQAFLADNSETAYEKVVDRLLEDSRYGERWGRHWMDIWRYSSWYGRRSVPDVRNSYPGIWRWRDWIIRSLNEDKPYDRMIIEMLAADEIAPENDETIAATGFLVRNWFALNSEQWRRDQVEHTGKAFLGLTLNCAHCHDHKYDPISQREYFAFRAFFEPIELRQDRVPGGGHIDKYVPYVPGTTSLRKPGPQVLPRVFDDRFDDETRMYAGGDERNIIQDEPPVAPSGPAIVGGDKIEIQPIELPEVAAYPGLKEFVRREEITKRETTLESARQSKDRARIAAAEADLKAIHARIAADRVKYEDDEGDFEALAKKAAELERLANLLIAQTEFAAAEKSVPAAEAEVKQAGEDEAKKKSAEAALKKAKSDLAAAQKKLTTAKAAQSKTDVGYTPLSPSYHQKSTGRRTALANWIASPENPLTARVAVNHLWARHFRQPLAEPVYDFGRRGKAPTHPKLIDWLASELIAAEWKMKPIHRLIVTSRAYRLDSAASETTRDNLAADPDNRFLWRFRRDQAEAEVIRDSILHVTGRLDPTPIYDEIPNKEADTALRRTVYFETFPEEGGKGAMVALFDAPDPCDCYQRSSTVMPQQALAILNNPLTLTSSRVLARELANQFPDEDKFITAAFESILTRGPSADELAACRGFLMKQRDLYASAIATKTLTTQTGLDVPPSDKPQLRSRETLVQTLFGHSEFVTLP
ncbi:MAG: DUF1549 domain-containing protein [Verrucomicrobiales bacterium]|nr:DUF1549 domain-containing protein [Verrucomicrobiales bacterium]